jgi:hypothetical protein
MTSPRLVLVLYLALATTAHGQVTDCAGSIKGHSAAFFIENQVGDGPFSWFKKTSPPGLVEYMWTVTPGTLQPDGTLDASATWFGLVLTKREGSEEARGSLDELFRVGLAVLVRNNNERDPDAKIKIGRHRNGVIIGINDPETFRKVFGGRPTGARIEAFLPAAQREHSCIVSIEYE